MILNILPRPPHHDVSLLPLGLCVCRRGYPGSFNPFLNSVPTCTCFKSSLDSLDGRGSPSVAVVAVTRAWCRHRFGRGRHDPHSPSSTTPFHLDHAQVHTLITASPFYPLTLHFLCVSTPWPIPTPHTRNRPVPSSAPSFPI
jgi:hypothetical protein